MPCLNITYYDPFDADEEAYVASHYADGERADLIARFYEAMRQWRSGDQVSPFHEAADARHYPDMAHAGKVGIFAMGQAIIRNYQREYWQSVAVAEQAQPLELVPA